MKYDERQMDAGVLTRLNSYKYTCVMIAAEKIGLFDDLIEKTTVEAIAKKRDYELEPLQRLVFGLEMTGLAYRDVDGWQLTAHGMRVNESPSQIRAQIRMAEYYMAEWAGLHQAVLEPLPQGKVWATRARDPQHNYDFQQCMRSNVDGVVPLLMKGMRIPVTGVVVDVGGGMGDVLAAVLTSHPKLAGVLVELPEVATRALEMFLGLTHNVQQRFSVLEGSVFDDLFSWRGDLNMLINVLHDWNDECALVFLRKCALTAPKLIIIERVVKPGREFKLAMHDLHMMAVTGGKQRSLQQHSDLLGVAGFDVTDYEDSENGFSVIEASLR